MADINTLKPGDSIVHVDPYNGEGEKMIVESHLPFWPGHTKVITVLSKFTGLNGGGSYIDHEVIEKYYRKVS